jgi:fumarate reductase subunit D
VKLAEAGLIFCLAVHAIGGLRLLMLEAFGWTPRQRALAIGSVVASALLGSAFLISA